MGKIYRSNNREIASCVIWQIILIILNNLHQIFNTIFMGISLKMTKEYERSKRFVRTGNPDLLQSEKWNRLK